MPESTGGDAPEMTARYFAPSAYTTTHPRTQTLSRGTAPGRFPSPRLYPYGEYTRLLRSIWGAPFNRRALPSLIDSPWPFPLLTLPSVVRVSALSVRASWAEDYSRVLNTKQEPPFSSSSISDTPRQTNQLTQNVAPRPPLPPPPALPPPLPPPQQ